MNKFFALCLTALLVACSSDPEVRPIQMDYASFGKLYLDSSDLRIIDRSRMTPQTKPYVGHLFSPTLTQAAHSWAAERFQAVGKLGHATVIIKDANVSEQPLDVSSGFQDMFTRHQASKYIGRLEVSLEAQAPSDASIGMATATAVHAVTLPENPTAYEKQEAYRTLLTSLMATLDKNMKDAVQKHLSRFLLSGPGDGGQTDVTAPTIDSAMPSTIQRY